MKWRPTLSAHKQTNQTSFETDLPEDDEDDGVGVGDGDVFTATTQTTKEKNSP